jgi:ATP-dependent exoDNAse (exonuclease V) beta subunit
LPIPGHLQGERNMTVREIYDGAASVALSASAGSGKTHALTTRLLVLLL